MTARRRVKTTVEHIDSLIWVSQVFEGRDEWEKATICREAASHLRACAATHQADPFDLAATSGAKAVRS
jgi:hypothetical protein